MKRFTINTAFIFGMIFLSNISFSQEKNFQINGIVRGIDTGSIKIVSLLSDPTRPSSLKSNILHGKFTIQGKMAHALRVYLVLNNSLYSDDFFIEPGSQNIYFDATNNDSFYNSMKITGSLVNDQYINSYQKPLAPFYASLDSCYSILDSLNKSSTNERDLSAFAEICKNIELANKKVDSVREAFIVKHPSSFVSLWALYNSIGFLENLEFVKECFRYLDKKLKNSMAGKQLAQRLKIENTFLNGKIFPFLIVSDSTGKKISVRDSIKGKYTLIDFWFSRCGPCIVKFPKMRNLFAKYKDAGFDIMGITVDKTDNKKNWLDAIIKHQLNWTQYWDVDGKEANKFIIDTYPTTFLLDSKGRIIKKNILLEELEIWLAKNLK